MKKHISILMLSLAFWVSNLFANANNIKLSNFTLIGKNTTPGFINVQFDL